VETIMTAQSFAPMSRPASLAGQVAPGARTASRTDHSTTQGGLARLLALVPGTEMVPALAAAAVMVVCLTQIF
jgi:hypothetical protein